MTIDDQQERLSSEQQIPVLKDYLRRLVTISRELVYVDISEDDDFAFMALSFLMKQIEHSGSILRLDYAVDAKLIARSMLEGMGYLLWAGLPVAPGESSRAALWRYYYAVINWRVVQRALATGVTFAPDLLQEVQTDPDTYGPWYIESPKRPDPYRRTWHGASIWRIFKDIDEDAVELGHLQANAPGPGEVLYQDLYSEYSAWHHWDVGGLAQVIASTADSIRYDSLTRHDTAQALRTAYYCTLVSALAVNGHLSRGRDQDLDNLNAEYHAWLGRTP
jgi:hypothetical protein